MTGEEALRLLDNGFTADEIRAMAATPEAPEEGAPDEPKNEPTNDPTNDSAVVIAELTKTVKELQATVKDIQTSNIHKATGGKTDPRKETVDKAMKSFTDSL